jgi:hypothetical protein
MIGSDSSCFRHVEKNLKAILTDLGIELEERSEVLYASAVGLVKDVLDDPRSGLFRHCCS